MSIDYGVLKGYEPTDSVDLPDGFGIIKGNRNCTVDSVDLDGSVVKYTLKVNEGEKDAGRLIWGSCNLENEIGLKIMCDIFHRIGLADAVFSNETELKNNLTKFGGAQVKVRCYPSKEKKNDLISDDPNNYWQRHSIKGLVGDPTEATKPPF